MKSLLNEIQQDSQQFRECLAQEDWSSALAIARARDEKVVLVFEHLDEFDLDEVRSIMEMILSENNEQVDTLNRNKCALAGNVKNIRETFSQLQQYSRIEEL